MDVLKHAVVAGTALVALFIASSAWTEEGPTTSPSAVPEAGTNPLRARQLMGILRVMSDPNGLEVRIDGRSVGVPTPFELEVTAGKHRLTARRNGVEVERKVNVPVDGKETVEFDLETERGTNQAIESVLAEITKDCVLVKGGTFEMGDSFGDGGKDERPVHTVTLSDFHLSRTEVTVGQYRLFVEQTGYRTEAEREGWAWSFLGKDWEKRPGASWRAVGFPQTDDEPVVDVSWNDAAEFVRWLSGKTGRPFRLPTEAEWEYAARSGGRREKWAGTSNEGELGAFAWHSANSSHRTHPVGQKTPNGLGLYDMSGNVWEWCQDWSGAYPDAPAHDPQGPPSGTYRVTRGGSWQGDASRVRATRRTGRDPSLRGDYLGFRLALSAQ